MKKNFIYISTFLLAMVFVIAACSEDFLEKQPQGALSESVLGGSAGVDAMLVSAYGTLDGWVGWSVGAPWSMAGTNWTYGDVYADDAYKGSDIGDQAAILEMERYVQTSTNPYSNGKFRADYDGVARVNDALRVLAVAKENGLDAGTASAIEAELRFLRAHYVFDAIKIFGNVPWVSEDNLDGLAPNPGTPYAEVEADFEFAVANLGVTPRGGDVGRATKGAAQAMLAKVKLAQGDYSGAKPLLDAVIASGQYALNDSYQTAFLVSGDNSPESVFAYQASINDGSGEGANGNYGSILNFTYTGGPGACCGFHQPSQNLVNAYKTSGGLPMLTDFNASDVTNDEGVASADPFTEYAGELDPRLDHAVGRRGIPYLDWGDHPGRAWIRDQALMGPYSPKKMAYLQAEEGVNSNAGGWGGGTSANNYHFVRYADVLLMAAECEVEVGSLETARMYVNMIRARAANVMVTDPDGSPAANYVIAEYTAPWTDQAVARMATRFERRLELSMEGHRFFDLKRWGVAESTINAYIASESAKRTYLAGSTFQSKHLNQPIPQSVIDESKGTLNQNAGY